MRISHDVQQSRNALQNRSSFASSFPIQTVNPEAKSSYTFDLDNMG